MYNDGHWKTYQGNAQEAGCNAEGAGLDLRLLRRLTNKEIARQLNISERTAKFHVANVVGKLGLGNRRNLLASPVID
jgi:hypothetical protein